MLALLSLGFVLSLDNFRSSLVLGGLKPSFSQSVKTSAIFGVWDGLAPLAGLLVGEALSKTLNEDVTNVIVMVGLGVYGVFLIVRSLVSPDHADPDLKWARWGLPVPLSLDNVAAGTALGAAGFNPWLAPILFAVMTFVMSLAGHQLGRGVANLVARIPRVNTDLIVGTLFLLMAILMAFGVALPFSDD